MERLCLENDCIRYPRDPIMIIYKENKKRNKPVRDLNFFPEEYVGEQLLSPIITVDKLKTFYPIGTIDLGFQVYYIMQNKIGFF